MKNIKVFFILILIVSSVISCAKKDDNLDKDSDVKLNLNFKLNSNLLATSTNFSAGYAVGVFLVPASAQNFTNAIAKNRQYSYDTNTLGFTLQGAPIYYPQEGNVDLIAYGPFTTTILQDSIAINTRFQSDLSSLDLVYSRSNQNLSKSSTPVNVALEHQLARVNFIYVNETGLPDSDLEDMTVIIRGVNTKANFSLKSGNFFNPNTKSDILLSDDQAALLIPHIGHAGREIEFSTTNLRWVYAISVNDNFLRNVDYTYTITLKPKEIEVSLTSATVREETALDVDIPGTIPW